MPGPFAPVHVRMSERLSTWQQGGRSTTADVLAICFSILRCPDLLENSGTCHIETGAIGEFLDATYVPLKAMCSRKWAVPLVRSVSAREPASIQTPTVAV